MNTILQRTRALGCALAWLIAVDASVQGATVIDGSITGAEYGAAVAIQSVDTGFGDNDGFNKGSELNAAYARIDGGFLNIGLTGNLEDNFNKLVLFFDSVAGGQNVLDADVNSGGSNPVTDPSPFPPDPGMFQKMVGTTFDAGFAADYALIIRHGYTGIDNRLDVDYAELNGATSQYLGVLNPLLTTSGVTGVGANASPISIGFDNANTAGVLAGTAAANSAAAAAVTTGVEIGISLADLGNPAAGDQIKITAYITNSNHDYVSNQFLGGMPAFTENLGSDGIAPPFFFPGYTFFNLNNFSGDQFFTVSVIPEPPAAFSALIAVISFVYCAHSVSVRKGSLVRVRAA